MLMSMVGSQDTRLDVLDLDFEILNPDIPTQYTNCTVDICAMGDDTIELKFLQNAGDTYTTLVGSTSWTSPITYTYTSLLSVDSRFLFIVTDSWYEYIYYIFSKYQYCQISKHTISVIFIYLSEHNIMYIYHIQCSRRWIYCTDYINWTWRILYMGYRR